MKSFLGLYLLGLWAGSASAAATGIQYLDYNRNAIPNIVTAAGIASEIIFEEDEVIEYATFGFDSAWESQVVRDHILVFKAKDAEPETNLIVHTNKRDYLFTVTSGNNDWTKNPNSSGAVYSLRLNYRDNKSKAALAAKKKAEEKANEKGVLRNSAITMDGPIHSNYDYRATENAQDLIPYRVWDNGTLTFIAFRPGTKRGVVYELDANKKPALVNQHTEKNGLLVVHNVYSHLIIRLGDDAVELRRNTAESAREENPQKTTVKNAVRTVANDAPTAFKMPPAENPGLNLRRLAPPSASAEGDKKPKQPEIISLKAEE